MAPFTSTVHHFIEVEEGKIPVFDGHGVNQVVRR